MIATCTGVSFAHGSNDGQKGIGLIMLVLIGIVPTNPFAALSEGKVLQIIFFSALMGVMYHLNVMQGIVRVINDRARELLGVTAAAGTPDAADCWAVPSTRCCCS